MNFLSRHLGGRPILKIVSAAVVAYWAYDTYGYWQEQKSRSEQKREEFFDSLVDKRNFTPEDHKNWNESVRVMREVVTKAGE